MPLTEKMNELLNDRGLCAALGRTIREEIASDDESPYKVGFYLIKAFRDGSVDDALIALCGWSFETLLEKAEKKKQNMKDEDE